MTQIMWYVPFSLNNLLELPDSKKLLQKTDWKWASFWQNALSSWNPNKVLETVHHIFNSPNEHTKQTLEGFNQYFTELTSKLTNNDNVVLDQTKLVTITTWFC